MGLVKLGLIIGFVYAFVAFPEVRFTVFHFPTVFYNACVDVYKYVRFKRWNECRDYGRMDIYVADERQPFGSGKTLNMVRSALNIYKNYNNVQIFDFETFQWVTQYVHIYSNLKLMNVPYVPLTSTQQMIDISKGEGIPDDGNRHIYLFLFDELGRVFNNREWKTNINTDFLSALLQQRKNKIIVKGTVQDFSLFDATMRKISSKVYSCTKKWRFLTLREYYAHDIERAGFNTELIAVRSLVVNFATDKLYESYDTNEVVGDIVKEIQSGQRLSNEEILNSSGTAGDLNTLTRIHKKYKRRVSDGIVNSH